PDRIMQLMLFSPGWAQGRNGNAASVPEFNVLREQHNVFDEIAAYEVPRGINLTGIDPPEQMRAVHVSADYFALFGANAVMRPTFPAGEDRPGGPSVAVISDGLRQRRFAGVDPVGQLLTLGGEAFTVIGVIRRTVVREIETDVLLPLRADPASTN